MAEQKGEFDVAPEELPAELVIELEPPIVFQGANFAELRLREPTSGAVRKAEVHLKSTTSEAMRLYQIALVSNVTGMPIPAVEMLPISKLNRAASYLGAFSTAHLPKAPQS